MCHVCVCFISNYYWKRFILLSSQLQCLENLFGLVGMFQNDFNDIRLRKVLLHRLYATSLPY